MLITENLLQKYNVPVPRYTSYPPANHFTEKFREDDYLKLLNESNSWSPESIALYVHIPFCRKICHYCGCNACAIGRGNSVKPYMEALKAEIELVAANIDTRRPVTQLHYGGGTPNAIDASMLNELNEFLFSKFNFTKTAEIAIECNPAYLSFSYAESLLKSGFNRFSLGIQDFENSVLKTVNREPSAIPADELLRFLKAGENDVRVNMDFIYGLPGQTAESFLRTISKAIEIRPDRLVTFSYAHVPWMKKHQLILEKAGLPASGEKMNMFLGAYDLLKGSGYQPIGLDHFVLPGDDLFLAMKEHKLHRNFQGYCTRKTTGQVYAFGVTAISQLEKGYSQNIKDVEEYISTIGEGRLPVERGCLLSEDQITTREVITELMCNLNVSFPGIAHSRKITSEELRNSIKIDETVLSNFAEDGLISLTPDSIEVTEKGTFFIRNIAASLDRGYNDKVHSYSKTV
jgi:oxygen-independent coproporphyrinogen-3 oxidase